MPIRMGELLGVEIVHFASPDCLIWSRSNMVSVDYGEEARKFYLPNVGWHKPAAQLRLTRRAARLDKCNVFPVFEVGELVRLLVIRQGSVYTIDYHSGATTQVLRLMNCRNVLHQSICRTPKIGRAHV